MIPRIKVSVSTASLVTIIVGIVAIIGIIRVTTTPPPDRSLETLTPGSLRLEVYWDVDRRCIDGWGYSSVGFVNLSTFMLRVPRVQVTEPKDVLVDLSKGIVFQVDRAARCPLLRGRP